MIRRLGGVAWRRLHRLVYVAAVLGVLHYIWLAEKVLLAPLVILMLVIGLYPKVLLDRVQPSAEAVLDRIEATTDYVAPAPGRLSQVLMIGEGE